MTITPNVIDNEDLYNVITLDGRKSPGQVTLSGHDSIVNWDVQAGPFLKGAIVRFKSAPPVQFSASFYLLKDGYNQGINDFDAWDSFQKVIESSVANPRQPKALTIYHPDLARNNIKSVVKHKIGGMVYDKKGGGTIVVEFQVYAPPRKWDGIPASKPVNDPNAQLKVQVAKLTAQYQATPWQR